MALKSNISSNPWVQVRREAGAAQRKAVVRVRPSGDIALSVDFVRAARIADLTRVNLYVSEDGYKIGMKFHSDASIHDSFLLCRDGGSGARLRGSDARVIQIGGMRGRSPAYSATMKADARERTFVPEKDVHGIWAFEIRPSFECSYGGLRGELASSESGIYRYLWKGETVYIGKGQLLSRFGEAERQDWDFDAIEYSILNDPEKEAIWESYWIELFREKRNRLPIYNRISGRKVGQTINGVEQHG